MEQDPTNWAKLQSEESLGNTAAILGTDGGALRSTAEDNEPGILGRPDGRRAFRIGDRVRVCLESSSSFGDTATIRRPSRTQQGFLAVRFDGEEESYHFPPADLAFVIDSDVRELFPELVERHGRWMPFLRGYASILPTLSGQDWATLGIDVPPEHVRTVWAASGSIPFRWASDPTVKLLVIGCGNRPLPEQQPGHAHGADVYTIDPDFRMGPTVVGAFGYEPVQAVFLPNQFRAITFEGYAPFSSPAVLTAQPHFLPGLRQLLCDGGAVRFSIGMGQTGTSLIAEKHGTSLSIVQADVGAWKGQELTYEWLMATLTGADRSV